MTVINDSLHSTSKKRKKKKKKKKRKLVEPAVQQIVEVIEPVEEERLAIHRLIFAKKDRRDKKLFYFPIGKNLLGIESSEPVQKSLPVEIPVFRYDDVKSMSR